MLAATTVPLGALANLPTWGIFLGWAAASLAMASGTRGIWALVRALPMGALCAALTLMVQSAVFAVAVQSVAVPQWIPALAVLVVINPFMILLGRTAWFSSVPGIFVGFSTVLAGHAGGFGPVPGSIGWAMATGAVMNLVGIAFFLAYGRLTGAAGTAAINR
jgi:hypothetical protein